MLSTSNVSIQFGAKPLFEGVTVKFGDGNRYGLIGANGSGKSTFMKILSGEIEQSSGEVMLQAGLRLGKLNQNQFAYEDERVLDVVLQGHQEMWHAMKERDLIYADAHATDEDYMKAAELEAKFRGNAALVLPHVNVDRVLRAVDGLAGTASLAHLLTALRVEDKPR